MSATPTAVLLTVAVIGFLVAFCFEGRLIASCASEPSVPEAPDPVEDRL